jgi:hypothetical protein
MWHIHGGYGFSFPELGDVAIRHAQGGGPTGRYGCEMKWYGLWSINWGGDT